MLRTILACLAFLGPAAAAAQEAPDALVKRVTDEVLTIIKSDKDLQSGNSRKIAELAEAKVLPHFDFQRMTRLAVGRNWQQANDAQKEQLVKEFRTMLVTRESPTMVPDSYVREANGTLRKLTSNVDVTPEVTRAVREETDERVDNEAADLLYHLAVLLCGRGRSLGDAGVILNGRRG